MQPADAQRLAPWLWLLFGLFLFRVLAQPLALVLDNGVLPRFEAWHSGALPYPVLLASQIFILYWQAHSARRFAVGDVRPKRSLGIAVLGVAAVYFAVMLLRLVLGATILSHVRWFASPLPTAFHLVLAGFLLLYGYFHVRHGGRVDDGATSE